MPLNHKNRRSGQRGAQASRKTSGGSLQRQAVEDSFRCPMCRGGLSHASGVLACKSCRKEFELLGGEIPDFSLSKDFYFGSIPRETMLTMLQQSDDLGWRSAFRQMIDTLPVRKQEALVKKLSEDRAAWKYLLDLSKNKRVLDCGSGLGAISVALARSFGEVVSLDLTGETLLFLRKWSNLLGLKNITLVKGGDTPFLPFPRAYFDVVVLNGVLEWIPDSRKGDPKQAQLDILKEFRRVLKPDGECYIGIENRFSYRYFMGRRDDHTGLLFGSLLPRPIANVYSLAVKKKPYRNYTYSILGYRRLLKRAGFKTSQFFAPLPMYRRFSQLVGLSGCGRVRPDLMKRKNRSAVSVLFGTKLLRYFTPSFSIVAKNRAHSQSFLERLVCHVLENASVDDVQGWIIRHFVISSGKASIMLESAKGDLHLQSFQFIIKIPMTPYSTQKLQRNAETLRAIWNSNSIPESLRRRTPRSVASGRFAGQPYFVEQRIPGVSGESLQLSLGDKEKLMGSAADILTEFQLATCTSVTVDESIVHNLFVKPVMEVADFLGYDKNCDSLRKITSVLERMALGNNLPLVWSHGDFSLKNLLVDETSVDVLGVIDWDLSNKASLPLIDLLHLLLRAKMKQANMSSTDALFEHLFPLRLEGVESDILTRYVEALSIHPSLMTPLSIMYWISRPHGHVGSFKDLDPAWVDRNFRQCIDELGRRL